MRDALCESLVELARADERVLLMVADIGTITFDAFRRDCPDRFLNMGVAEANMVGVAAGLALSGKIPFVYTIGSFLAMRAFEQIRDDVCYQNQKVRIVAVGGGLVYSTLGCTHHLVEDLAMFRAVPNMVVLSPCDPAEAAQMVRAVVDYDGPVYIRLSKAGEPAMHDEGYQFRLGKACRLRPGKDMTFIATGAVMRHVVEAARRLASRGVGAGVLDMSTIKPLDREAVLQAAGETSRIVTVEEHNVLGGLGGAVAEVIAESGNGPVRLKRLGIPDRFVETYGTHDDLLAQCGLDADSIAAAAEAFVGER